MSSGTKVYRYRCDRCRREVELVTDNRRPDPLRCIITDQCLGFLKPESSRRGERARLTSPQAGLVDKIARGARSVSVEAPAAPVLVPMTTFSDFNGMALAGPIRQLGTSSNGSQVSTYAVQDTSLGSFKLEPDRAIEVVYPLVSQIAMLVYELTADVLQSQQYVFVFNGIAQVAQGIDNSKEQRLLRFTTTDNIKVFANGIELDSTEFDRNLVDMVRLTPGIVASEVTIEVHVYKDRSQLIDESMLVTLMFSPLNPTVSDDLTLRTGNAWGDALRVVTPDGYMRNLLFCTDMSALELQKTYAVARFEGVSHAADGSLSSREILADGMWMLLSDPPHAFIDKRLDQVINGASLVADHFNFTFDLSEATGTLVPVADLSSVTNLTLSLAPQAEVLISPATTSGTANAYPKRPLAYVIGPA